MGRFAALGHWFAALAGAAALVGSFPAGASGVSGAAAGGEWQANDDDAWLLDLRSGQFRLGEGVRGYQTPDGLCVDFADVVMALDLAIRIDKKSRRATGWAFDERRSLAIDRDAGEVRLASRAEKLGPTTIRDTPEGWCVATGALSAWLGVTLTPDLGNAILKIDSPDKLPFQLQAERRARAAGIRPATTFDLATLPQASRDYRLWQAPSVDVVASAGIVRDAGRVRGVARYEIFASGEVAGASFDARLSSDDRGVPQSLRMRAYRSDPSGELLGPLRATHVAVGDVAMLATGLVAQNSGGRGAVITNRPLERPDSFDRTQFRGDLPAGWDAELYRNGELLAFAAPRADGRYEFLDVPLRYGQNRFEVVLYGPQGQVRREYRVQQVGLDSIPPNKTWYWAGIAQENRDLIQFQHGPRVFRRGWRGTMGVERGVDSRTSVAAYAHSLLIDDVRRNFGEVALRRALGPSVAELSAAHASDGGSAVRAQWLAELGGTLVRAEAMRGFNGFVSDRLRKDVRGFYELSVDPTLTVGRTMLPLHFDLRYLDRRGGFATLEASARTSVAFRTISLTGGVEWRQNRTPVGPDPPPDVAATLLANARIGPVRLRGEARVALSGVQRDHRFQLTGEWAASERAEWRAEVGYQPTANRFRAALGHSRRFDRFSVSGIGEIASDGSLAASVNVAFSLGPDPARDKWRMSSAKLAASGQVSARVWRDTNADGVRQADEPWADGITLTAGARALETTTGKDGSAMIDGLEPHRAVMIGIDAGALGDPYVQAGLPGVVVVPRPGVATEVRLPLVAAGEVDGTLVRAGGGELGGIGLELVDAAGRVRATTVSEYDGFFLFEGVAYGRYRVRLVRAAADAARLDPGFAVDADVSASRPRARLGTLALRPAGGLADAEGTGPVRPGGTPAPAR